MDKSGKGERFLAGFLILAIGAFIWYFFVDPAKATPYLVAVFIIAVIFIFSIKQLHKKRCKNR